VRATIVSQGQIVDCLDVFQNKAGVVRELWRPSEIRDVTNDHVLVHFLNWDHRWDIWLNMHCSRDRIAPEGSCTGLETDEQRLAREDDERFIAEMMRHDLRVVRMAPDGSCLFRSLAHQIYGDPERHMVVRADIVRHMGLHRERYAVVAVAATGDADFERYLADMSKAGAWGGYPEQMAAEELFDRPMVLYSGADFLRSGLLTPMARLDDPASHVPSVEPMRISYHGERHFNSVELATEPSLSSKGGLGGRDSDVILAHRERAFQTAGPARFVRSASFSSPMDIDRTPLDDRHSTVDGSSSAARVLELDQHSPSAELEPGTASTAPEDQHPPETEATHSSSSAHPHSSSGGVDGSVANGSLAAVA
jgi:hypothetical protein